MSWYAEAPSNIALIKYMGKRDEKRNIPDNASLSYTLPHLFTRVSLTAIDGKQDRWEPLSMEDLISVVLSREGIARFLSHLQRMKEYFHYDGSFLVRSGNNFPASAGLASSASSFAALTKCAIEALSKITKTPVPDVFQQAELSRLGSGSSCRSFLEPFVLWKESSVEKIDFPYDELIHRVLLIETEEKKISSGEAHRRVKTSPYYENRTQHAEERLFSLIKALEGKDWECAKDIAYAEFQEMHHLFETAKEPFYYQTKTSKALLECIDKQWKKEKDGPIITMDAGPNIHLLYRKDQKELLKRFEEAILREHHVNIL